MVIIPTEELEDINEISAVTPTLESVVKQIVKKIAVKQPVQKPVVKQQTVKKAVVVEQLSTPTRDVLDKISALFNSAVSDDDVNEISEIEEDSASNIFITNVVDDLIQKHDLEEKKHSGRHSKIIDEIFHKSVELR